jgi:hypothetical protein
MRIETRTESKPPDATVAILLILTRKNKHLHAHTRALSASYVMCVPLGAYFSGKLIIHTPVRLLLRRLKADYWKKACKERRSCSSKVNLRVVSAIKTDSKYKFFMLIFIYKIKLRRATFTLYILANKIFSARWTG